MVKRRKEMQAEWRKGEPLKCKAFTSADTHRVWSVQLEDKRMISGSTSCTLQVWDLAHSKPRHSLRGHTAEVRCHQFVDNLLVSGGYGTSPPPVRDRRQPSLPPPVRRPGF